MTNGFLLIVLEIFRGSFMILEVSQPLTYQVLLAVDVAVQFNCLKSVFIRGINKRSLFFTHVVIYVASIFMFAAIAYFLRGWLKEYTLSVSLWGADLFLSCSVMQLLCFPI
jgi:hypothetical protein